MPLAPREQREAQPVVGRRYRRDEEGESRSSLTFRHPASDVEIGEITGQATCVYCGALIRTDLVTGIEAIGRYEERGADVTCGSCGACVMQILTCSNPCCAILNLHYLMEDDSYEGRCALCGTEVARQEIVILPVIN